MLIIKNLLNKYASFISITLLLIFWQLCGYLNLLPKFIIPTPLEIIKAFIKNFSNLLLHSKVTILEALIGLFISIILAWILAIIMDSISILNKIIYPLLIVSQTIPTIALAPILVLWLGYGLLPKIVLIIITTLFPIIISILDGFRQTDNDILNLFKIMQASKGQILYHAKIPMSLPYFFAGLRVSVSYAFISAVVAEWLGGFEGLGVYMIKSKKLFEYDTMFAIIILISIISLLSIEIVKFSEKKIIK